MKAALVFAAAKALGLFAGLEGPTGVLNGYGTAAPLADVAFGRAER